MATAREAAKHIFVSLRTFEKKLQDGVISRQPTGEYDLETVRREELEHHRKTVSSESDYSKARARKMSADAEVSELELQHKRGELVHVDQVTEAVAEEYGFVRGRLTSLPGNVAAGLVHLTAQEIQTRLQKEVEQILEALNSDEQFKKHAAAAAQKGSKGRSKTTAKAQSD